MNLGRYLKNLLFENETVIVPGLGAFISHYLPAKVDNETETVTPPSKTIYFDKRVKTDDSLLVNYISNREQITSKAALLKILKERDKILYELDATGYAVISGFGELLVDESGEVFFNLTVDDNLLIDSYGLSELSFSEKKLENFTDQQVVLAESVNDTIDTDPLPDNESNWYNEYVTTDHEQAEKKDTKHWLWLLLLLIPGIIFWIIKRPQNDKTITTESNFIEQTYMDTIQSKAEIDSVKTDDQVIDSLSVDLIIAKTEGDSVQSTITPYKTIIPDSTKFYLIGGSFLDFENALNFLEKMEKHGYNPFFLESSGKFHLIGVAEFSSEREAFISQIDYSDRYPDSGAWIYMFDRK